MAPEMVQNQTHDRSVDIWAMGILLYELAHGHAPYRATTKTQIANGHRKGTIVFKDGLSADYKDLVTLLLK